MNTKIVALLENIVGKERVSQTKEHLDQHAKDKSFNKPQSPDVVVWAKTTKEVSEIVKIANKYNTPITAWGAGTSLQGNPIPTKGGIVLNMSLMNHVLEVSKNGFQVRVQPGIICDGLNEHLRPYDLFLPAFPGSSNIATIGGVIANNSGGMYAVKYGVVGDYVMALEVVLANGDIVKLGSRSIKSVSGYNLVDMFVGSSGTLGIITEATLKLLPIPPTRMAALVSFANVTDVGNAIMDILHADIHPAALEHMDEEYAALVNKVQQDISLKPLDTLLIELHGTHATLAAQLKHLEQICKRNNCVKFAKFVTPNECNKLWGCRKGIRLAFYKMAPNTGILSAEAGVPLPYVPEFIKKVKELQRKYGVTTLNHGHVGDGNFHAWALYDLTDLKSLEKAKTVNDKLIHFALSVGGTATGEHGLGIDKKRFLPLEHPTSMPLMLAIKKTLDPKGILNPGKIFPD